MHLFAWLSFSQFDFYLHHGDVCFKLFYLPLLLLAVPAILIRFSWLSFSMFSSFPYGFVKNVSLDFFNPTSPPQGGGFGGGKGEFHLLNWRLLVSLHFSPPAFIFHFHFIFHFFFVVFPFPSFMMDDSFLLSLVWKL